MTVVMVIVAVAAAATAVVVEVVGGYGSQEDAHCMEHCTVMTWSRRCQLVL